MIKAYHEDDSIPCLLITDANLLPFPAYHL
jgi:hypothetical protein